MKRPLGVTILAVFYLLGSFLFLAVLVVALLQPAFLSNLSNPNLADDIQRARNHEGVQEILIVIFAAIGVGLWSLKSMARRIVLVITGLHLVRQAYVLTHAAESHQLPVTFFWFATTISAAMFIYLLQPHVRRAFTTSQV